MLTPWLARRPTIPSGDAPMQSNGLSAGARTKHGPQRSNSDEVVIIVLGVELRAVDKPHRYLQSLMEGCRKLKLR